ncbi:MAG: D-alanine--D-alanine ligase [Marinilabiliales bacterium]
MKKNIAIVAGGLSKENAISIKSSETVMSLIDKNLFEVYRIIIDDKGWTALLNDKSIPVDKSDFSINFQDKKIKIDFAIIIIHGTPGEDGILQAYFDLLNIPYSTCGFFESALTFNKVACKLFLKEYGIITPKAVLIRKNQPYNVDEIAKNIGFPNFVKPNEGGSSFGTSKTNNISELEKAIQLAFNEDNEVIVEEFISGKEITCGYIETSKSSYVLPPTEIVPKTDFFDYQAKYEGLSDEITPARLSNDLINKCQDITKSIYKLLNCKGIVRVDYILRDNVFYFLEINTVPGMSKASIIPQQAKVAGVDLTKVYTEIINDAIK